MSTNYTSKNLPFSVPPYYFDSLEEQIWSRINKTEPDETLLNPVFSIPNTYFDSLSNSITNRIALEDVSTENEEAFLEMASPVLYHTDKKLHFTAPIGYFDSLEERICFRIKSIKQSDQEVEAGLIKLSDKTLPYFKVPKHYFEELENQIFHRVIAENVIEDLEDIYLTEKAPILSAVKIQNPFGVPLEYFKNLDETVLNKIQPEPIQVTEASQTGIFKTLLPYIAISVSIAAAFIIYFGMINNIDPQKTDEQLVKRKTEIKQEENIARTTEIVQYDEYDLIEAVSEDIEIENIALNPSGDKPSKDEMIEYLLENELDINSLEL